MSIQIAVDPGLTGGIAVLSNGRYYRVWSMPTEAKRTKGNQVDCVGLLSIAREIKALVGKQEILVAVERVGAMPKQGVSSMFSFGDSVGCARTFAAFFQAPVDYVPAAVWKKAMKLNERKQYSLARARRAFPAARELLLLRKHEGRAEALLLALYLYQTHRKEGTQKQRLCRR